MLATEVSPVFHRCQSESSTIGPRSKRGRLCHLAPYFRPLKLTADRARLNLRELSAPLREIPAIETALGTPILQVVKVSFPERHDLEQPLKTAIAVRRGGDLHRFIEMETI